MKDDRAKPIIPRDTAMAVPPHAEDIERNLLGAMIAAPAIIPAVRAMIRSSAVFWNDSHAAIYANILALADQTKEGAFDIAALVDRLRENDQLADVGGIDYLNRLANDGVIGGVSAHTLYCQILSAKFQRRQILIAAQQTAHLALTEPDVSTLTDRASSLLLDALLPSQRSHEIPLAVAATRAMDKIAEGQPTVYPTGYAAVDDLIGGIPRVGVVTVTGVPGSGKSSLVANLALKFALAGVGVRVFSFEMPAEKVASSMLAAQARQPVHRYGITGTQPSLPAWTVMKEAVAQFDTADLAFVEENIPAAEIFNLCCAYRKRGVRCVVVDYVQNLPPARASDSDATRIAEAARIMQRIAVQLGMLVFVVSQMTLESIRQDRPPKGSDMEGSGAIMKVSDMILGVYREVCFKPRDPDESDLAWDRRRRSADLHVLKNKFGQTGVAPLVFRGEWTLFTGVEDQPYVEAADDAAWEAGK